MHAPSYSIPVLSRTFGSWRISVDRSPFDQRTLAAHYDKKSRMWHRILNRHEFGRAYEIAIARIMRQPRYHQGNRPLRVLDAGVGTGAMSSAFCGCVRNRIHLAVIDISDAMLKEAQHRLEPLAAELSVKRASLDDLPYADSTFDVVLAAHVIEHLQDPQRALQEIFRVLKPGGLVICSVTRTSLIGAYVQFVWRTHRVSLAKALGWMRSTGLTSVRALPFDKSAAARRFSMCYAGRKPTTC